LLQALANGIAQDGGCHHDSTGKEQRLINTHMGRFHQRMANEIKQRQQQNTKFYGAIAEGAKHHNIEPVGFDFT